MIWPRRTPRSKENQKVQRKKTGLQNQIYLSGQSNENFKQSNENFKIISYRSMCYLTKRPEIITRYSMFVNRSHDTSGWSCLQFLLVGFRFAVLQILEFEKTFCFFFLVWYNDGGVLLWLVGKNKVYSVGKIDCC